MSKPKIRSERVHVEGNTARTTIHVTGGDIDTSLLKDLVDVTLVRESPDVYILTVTSTGTMHDLTVRNISVYNALLRYYEGHRKPLDDLIAEDRNRQV